MIEVLNAARELVARPDNDFAWSSWPDEAAALKEIDGFIEQLRTGSISDPIELKVIFLPTGPLQEVSVSSGWGDEFIRIARAFDATFKQLGC